MEGGEEKPCERSKGLSVSPAASMRYNRTANTKELHFLARRVHLGVKRLNKPRTNPVLSTVANLSGSDSEKQILSSPIAARLL